MSEATLRSVLFDCCIIDRLAAMQADPIRDMQADPIRDFVGTEFEVVCTPDLRLEYLEAERRASDKEVQQLACRFAVAAATSGYLVLTVLRSLAATRAPWRPQSKST